MQIKKVRVSTKVHKRVQKRGLEKQLGKAIKYILIWDLKTPSLKIRQPKSDGIFYFRINKQFRAICEIEKETLTILSISNHQE